MIAPPDQLRRTAAGRRGCNRRVPRPPSLGLDRWPTRLMRTFRNLLAITGFLSLLFGGCSKRPTSQSPVVSGAPILKIAVFADGRLTVDGATSTIGALQGSLRSLSERH